MYIFSIIIRCSLAKNSMVAEPAASEINSPIGCSLAKNSMVAERNVLGY